MSDEKMSLLPSVFCYLTVEVHFIIFFYSRLNIKIWSFLYEVFTFILFLQMIRLFCLLNSGRLDMTFFTIS